MNFKTGIAIVRAYDTLQAGFSERINPQVYPLLGTIKRTKKEGEGYMISFEKLYGGFLGSNHFPDKHAGEALIANREQAEEIARRFAHVTGDLTCNVYIINHKFSPMFENRIVHKRYSGGPSIKQSNWNIGA